MGFKMKGFNPGKGTNMGDSAFKRERRNPLYVENSDGSRFYPPKPEEKKFENYGDNLSVSPRSYTVTTDGTATTRKRANTDERHNEATYVIRNEDAGYDEYTQGFRTKENEKNEILYNNLESEIKDYNKDPLSVPINSHDFYSDNKNYISGLNDYYDEKKVDLAKEFKSDIPGLMETLSTPRSKWNNYDKRNFRDFRNEVRNLYDDKVNESRSLYNDIGIVHDRGYDVSRLGLDESSYGVSGMPPINETRLKVNDANQELLKQGKLNRVAKSHRDGYFEAIKKGNLTKMDRHVRALMERDPEFLATQPYWKMIDSDNKSADRHYNKLNKYLKKNPNANINQAMKTLGISKHYVTDLSNVERVDYNSSGEEILTEKDNYVYPYENETSTSDSKLLNEMDKDIENQNVEETSIESDGYQPQSVAIQEKENLENEIKTKEQKIADNDNDGVPNHLENKKETTEETTEVVDDEEPETTTGIGADRRYKEYIPQSQRT